MALMPVLAFFFTSAGPFLITVFVLRELFKKLKLCLSSKDNLKESENAQMRTDASGHLLKQEKNNIELAKA